MISKSPSASHLGLIGCVLWILTACSSGSAPGDGAESNTGDAELTKLEFGRLVDVYGLQTTPEGVVVELYDDPSTVGLIDGLDVVIGPDIQDERGPDSRQPDSEVLYDFIGSNPDNLQPRLLITRELGSAEFREAFEELDDRLKPVAAGLFGQDVRETPFTVVPRNAAIKLTFAQNVGVGDDFFVTRDERGRVTGLKNTEAVQLLEIVGDPRDETDTGDYRVVPTRLVVRGHEIVVDPVLLGTEGLQYRTQNNAAGMPESADQVGANMRIAVALEGPLSIPGVHAPEGSPYIGTNHAAERSIIRDFRSGNREDNTPDISRGFVRDAEPPRIVGQLLTYLERVDRVNDANQVVTIYKNGRAHEIDRGDVLRFIDPSTDDVIGASEIVVEPDDDLGDPDEQHVRCVIRTVPGLLELDPRRIAGYPDDILERERWLRENAPRVVLVSEFTASRSNPRTGEPYGDDPANFLTFSPSSLPLANGDPSPPTENVSPFASAIVRFSKPVDMTTVRAFDTLFFATRNVLDSDLVRDEFVTPNRIDPDSFDLAKFATPHLVVSRVQDDDGSQTAIRLQPTHGLYLDQEIRDADEGVPFEAKQFRYFLHLLGGANGVADLAGNSIDFQAAVGVQDFLVIPFSLDTRERLAGGPVYPDNRVVSIVRRFASTDEDEQPSYYRDGEFPIFGETPGPEAFRLQDLFGAVSVTGGRLETRPTARVRKVVDDLNQTPAPLPTSELRFCPRGQEAQPTATAAFGAGIQNPLNPFGARLQTAWREIDMSLSRIDPFDFNVDVEQMWWAPFKESTITYDVFDRVSLFLGHSEFRPEPCFVFLPTIPDSGLNSVFTDNYAHNLTLNGEKEDDLEPHLAYADQQLVIDPALAITEPNNVNRFLPLPEFQQPHFIWRDETKVYQGGNSQESSDTGGPNRSFAPYIISPWLMGGGRLVGEDAGDLVFQRGFLNNLEPWRIRQNTQRDEFTGGGLPAVALPLLADFMTYCDDPDLPVGNGFVATGFNGWQIAVAVTTNPWPNFRAYSGGFAGNGARPPICISPNDSAWLRATGGFTPTGRPTQFAVDNSVYWILADFLKRQTVVTFGFVDLLNPHRMPDRPPGTGDPRLGPFFTDAAGRPELPLGTLPRYEWLSEPSLEDLPSGTSIVPEFRAASALDPQPWRWSVEDWGEERKPDEINFPLDPLKACDAGIRKFDDRIVDGSARNYWAYYYNRQITDYTTEISDLRSGNFTTQFTNPRERFRAHDVRYFNWRMIVRNNVNASPPISPVLESFAVSYRFERQD